MSQTNVDQMLLRRLATAVPGATLHGEGDTAIRGLTFDSRRCESGFLFAALRGSEVDGHDFAIDAGRRGAVALLAERRVHSQLPWIEAADSRAALAAIAAEFFAHPSQALGVIGVTGTDGKTTTSYLVDHILRSAGHRTGLVGTVAIRVGNEEYLHPSRQTTPESCEIQSYLRQMVNFGADWAIVEATSHGLAMHRLDNIAFRIGAVTNITHEHLDFHGSVEEYRRAKAILLARVSEARGTVVINGDDPGAESIAPAAEGARIVRFSTTDCRADLCATAIVADSGGNRFRLTGGEFGASEIRLPAIGEFNVANALCATGVALAAGVSLEAAAAALASAPPVPGRMAPVDVGQPFRVIVDYAHTPDALEKVLRLLRRLHPEGRLIAVFGSAGERDIVKRPRQGAISARLADVTIVTSEDPRGEDAETIIAQIAAGAETAGAQWERSLFCRAERREAIALAVALARPGDCVLLAGKGHEQSIIWGHEKRPWDEASVAREVLIAAGYPSGPVDSC
jgi:UDP-N-acetylmuramoyl-L-alanyl-D-glutamate--2,6-diaminopimelate ligase